MREAEWERVQRDMLERLARELPPDLYYHGIHHTRDDVLPAAERLATRAGLDAEQSLLLKTAALYHDAGFLIQYQENEVLGAAIAAETLPHFGYTPAQIASIQALIRATRIPQQPQDLLQSLLCDADLDSLGRADYLETSHNLRQELAAHGTLISLRDWYTRQLAFLSDHEYFTEAARSLRDAGKQENIAELKRLLEDPTLV